MLLRDPHQPVAGVLLLDAGRARVGGHFEVPPDLAGFQVYHSRGLPPGPICTPGLASLQAAFNPDTQDGYLYFLAKGDGTNGHVFAHTYEEHQRNIEF